MGIVLCGGSSSRMGSDKGLLFHEGKTWAQLAGEKLSTFGVPVAYAINREQQAAYAEQYISPTFIDNDGLGVGGPLRGIFTAHLLFPNEDLFILACDLRDMQPAIISHLLDTHRQGVTVYHHDGFDEPLCGIYGHDALANLYGAYIAGKLAKYSLQYALQQVETQRLPIPEQWLPGFKNYNEPF